LAGKAVKGIHVVVEDRLPVSIVEINYFLTYFNDKGAIDQEKKREAQLLLARTRRDDVPAQQNDTVIDINPELSEKRYCREFRWTPTEKEADRLERQIEKILGIREQ
jgi:predicted transcriptional regulator